MYPNSELENYKLQVELLQEKLQRSEQSRNQLEHQLEHIVQRRHEIDKAARSKTRQKYQEFLDEQQKRNERNRRLLQMLERVDQQTATLSARSERLKMMKLQYEMYFAKLVQSQTLRCLQGSAAATAASGAGQPQMPILVAATPASSSRDQQELPAERIAAANQYDQQVLPTATYAPPPHFHAPHTAATAVAPSAAPRTWTLAMATPMSAGMLLAQPQTQAQSVDYIATAAATPYDYLPLPLGYAMPRLQRQHLPPDGFLAPLQRIATTLEADMPTLRAFERGVADASTPAALNAKLTPPAATEDKEQVVELITGGGGDSANQQLQPRRQELLSSMSPSSASSAPVPSSSSASRLTFDKLPKTLMAMTEHNFRSTDSAEYADDDDDKGAASMTTPAGGGGGGGAKTPQDGALHINEACGTSSTTTTTDDRRNYAYAAGDDGDGFSFGGGGNGAAHSDFRQKINEPWQQLSTAMEQPFMGATHTNPRTTEKFASSACGATPPRAAPSQTSKEASGGGGGSGGGGEQQQQQQLSIENIENAIYGELVNAPLMPAPARLPDIRNATLGLLEDAVAHSPPRAQGKEEEERAGATITQATPANGDAYPPNEVLDYVNYEGEGDVEGEGGASVATTAADTISSSSFIQDEPTYATINGNGGAIIATNNAEMYTEQPSEASESYEGVAVNVTDYQQYAADGSDPSAQQQQQQEADYSYANYDATQYDPNAYPGYTYDAATGEYTPDPAQQYVGDADGGEYALQPDYGVEQAAPSYTAAGQQEVNYDYANYSQDTPNDGAAVPAYPESVEPEAQSASSEIPAFNVELTPAEDAPATAAATAAAAAAAASTSTPSAVDEAGASKVIKPTSILATAAEKQQAAAAADGQRKKKRVNFVDSSDTDESAAAAAKAAVSVAGIAAAGASSESEFEFSTSGEGGAQIEQK